MSRLNQEKGIVSYHHPTSQEEVDLYMDELIKQHIVRWKDTAKMYSIFERAATASFYKDLAKQLFAKRWLSLPVLLVNGEVAAVNFGFEYGGKYLRCFPTFRDDFAKYSVARLLLIYLLQDAFTRGLTELDLLTGKQPYKLDLNPHLRRLYRISLSQRSIKGYASERWLLEIRPRLETLSKENAYLQQLNAWLLRVGFRKR
jgi:CelD/BcsL family acetyltransferase involved in cellulose biosynthesis